MRTILSVETKVIIFVVIWIAVVSVYIGTRDTVVQNPQPSDQPGEFILAANECGDSFKMETAKVVSVAPVVVRNGPGTQHGRMTGLNFGTEVVAFCTKGEWSLVSLIEAPNKPNGWVLSKFLELQPDPIPSYSDTYTPSIYRDTPAGRLVKRCADAAGIPVNQPNHAITPKEAAILTICIDLLKPK